MKPILRSGAVAAMLALSPPAALAEKRPADPRKVDLELFLAVDISRSMDLSEHTLQRVGYVDAFRNGDVINALLSGPLGRVAVTYVEWAGSVYPIVDWRIIDSREAALAFADELARAPVSGEPQTSISYVLERALPMILENDIESERQVIDVSGDGANNAGSPVLEARDAVLKQGIAINGLPIVLKKPRKGYDVEHLDRYYKHCVIGGPGAFIAPVYNLNQLSATIRKKLVMEIAALDIEPQAAPIQYREEPAVSSPTLTRVQLKLPDGPVDCLAGEKAKSNPYAPDG